MDVKIYNLFKNANNGPVLSKFLTIDEQKNLENKDFEIVFSETYPNEERKRVFIYPRGLEVVTSFNISIIKIKTKLKITHPEILGTVLSLGLTREVIGDIIIGDESDNNYNYSYIIVASEIKKYILDNLTVISKAKVELEEVDSLVDAVSNNYISDTIIIASLRLDAVIAKAIHCSRENAQELIRTKNIKINGNINTNNDYFLKEEDIISITKFGRVIIKDISRKTKKDKIVLNIERTK
jgi:RNA-binding protein YlmH